MPYQIPRQIPTIHTSTSPKTQTTTFKTAFILVAIHPPPASHHTTTMQPAFTISFPLPPQPRAKPVTKRRPSHHPRCSTTPPQSLSGIPHQDNPNSSSNPALPDEEEEIPLDLVDGYLDNAKVRPKLDIDADEYMLMWKLRRMLHQDDFNKIFDQTSRRIGEL